MALVAYDNSDSSEYEEETENPDVGTSDKLLHDLPLHVNLVNGQLESDQNLFNLLPKPTNQKTVIKEEDDEILYKKETISDVKPKSRITVPSLNDFKDVKDIVPNIKPKATKGKISGLLSLLPQPKNTSKATTKMLIPQSVSKKPHTANVKKKDPFPSPMVKAKVEKKVSLITDYSDESDDDVHNDFFSINKPVELPPDDILLDIDVKNENMEQSKKEPRPIESYFKKEEHVSLEPDNECMVPESGDPGFSSNHTEFNQNTLEENTNNDILDEEAILKLCGARGKRRREDIQIVDVNQQEILKDAREMLLRGLMDDTTKRQSHSKKKGNEPTSQQKRKHQITYLAHQAKANEAELQNQWANNRMTKRQTQSKYGF